MLFATRELGVLILLGIVLSLSHFSRSFLVSVHATSQIFLIHLVKWLIVSSKYRSDHVCNNDRKLYLLFGFLLPASCPLLILANGMVTYTDPPVDNAHNSFTATHTCSNGYQLVGDSIRICDISGSTGT